MNFEFINNDLQKALLILPSELITWRLIMFLYWKKTR
jgi:hypothetical protein